VILEMLCEKLTTQLRNSEFQQTVGSKVRLILSMVDLQVFREDRQVRTGRRRYLWRFVFTWWVKFIGLSFKKII